MTMSDFGSLKTSAMTVVVVVAAAFCLADSARANGRGGFGGCDGWGGIYCDNNDVTPSNVYYEGIYVEGPAVVYVPRYYIPRRYAIARPSTPRHAVRHYCAC
jgi:hypothetical protein